MSDEIVWADATELARLIRERHVSPVEVIAGFTRRIEAANPAINAVVTMAPDAMDRAAEAERAVTAGEDLGPLHGVPFTVKDCIDTAGLRTTRGSLLFADRVPDADATVVRRMLGAGAIMIGKTNMPEFALDADSDIRVSGATENPWCPGRSPGGSSGGEGAAIAAGMSPLGLGSDVGGSIRIPASFCGIVGLKATHGRIPLTGHWPDILLASMHVGPMARSVRDAALALGVLSGPDGADPYAGSVASPAPAHLEGPLTGLRVAWSKEPGFAPVDRRIQRAVASAADRLAELGAQMEPVDMEFLAGRDFTEDHLCAFNFEAVPAIAKLAEGRRGDLAPSTVWFAEAGQPSWERYLEARSRIGELRAWTGELMRSSDALLIPGSAMPAFLRGRSDDPINGRRVTKFHVTKTTAPWDYTGSPALSVPFGWTEDGLPIAVQVVGRRYDEATVLRIGAALEAASPDSGRRPPL